MTTIIDTHVHLGTSRFSGVSITETEIIDAMDHHNVASSLVMPQPTMEDIPTVHRQIWEISKRYPQRIYGMACIDPWLDSSLFEQEMKVCMEQYGFKAIKLHPLGHNISPLSPRCDQIYEAARRYHVPVLVHTGIGNPFSLPSLIMDPARRYPDVSFVLAHAGFAVYTDEAIVAAKYNENIILEPSWCPTYTIKKMINTIGIERLIMGSDHLTNLPVELMKYNSIGLTDIELNYIFHDNPVKLFKLNLEGR